MNKLVERVARRLCERCCPECTEDGECASGCKQTADFYPLIADDAKAALAVVAEWLDAEDPMYVFAAQSIRQQIKEPPTPPQRQGGRR